MSLDINCSESINFAAADKKMICRTVLTDARVGRIRGLHRPGILEFRTLAISRADGLSSAEKLD